MVNPFKWQENEKSEKKFHVGWEKQQQEKSRQRRICRRAMNKKFQRDGREQERQIKAYFGDAKVPRGDASILCHVVDCHIFVVNNVSLPILGNFFTLRTCLLEMGVTKLILA
ncbi:hypothetical protein AVEN_85009-1 [Araneus ventricosus]|uniref:Uncharacterized protein n=1 Tax=Araneus ventricosus TaxID=182803 RepID=A0A4Y2UA38_ARAVE|nr:hypothetical protein AVEN_85009-1 [Araneus ventricosus]